MNRKTNAPTEPKNIQKKAPKTLKKRTEVDNTLETEEPERSNRKRTEVDNTLETEQSNKRLKTADQASNSNILLKIFQQNTRILAKLDTVIAGQKELEDRLSKFESNNNNNGDKIITDQDFVKTLIKGIASQLLQTSIYPTDDEFRTAARAYFTENHDELFKRFKKDAQWIIYYEKTISSGLLNKHRSYRGSLVSRIKEALFSEFRELPPINANFRDSEIRTWKQTPAVKFCHKNLFKKINAQETNMSLIIKKLWKERKNAPKIHVAFAISICEMILNPNNQYIQLSEEIIKPSLMKNYQKLVKNDNFSYSDEEIEKETTEGEGEEEGVEGEEEGGEEEGDKEDRKKASEEEMDNQEDYFSEGDKLVATDMVGLKEKYKKNTKNKV